MPGCHLRMLEEVVRNTSFSGGIAMKYQFNQSINLVIVKNDFVETG